MKPDDGPPLRPRIEQLGEKAGAVALVVAIALGLLYALNRNEPLDLGFMGENYRALLEGAVLTLLVTGAAYFSGMALGFLFGWLRTSKRRILRGLSAGWVEALRGTPLFVQLLFLYNVLLYYLPTMESRLIVTGFLALLLNTSAYQAEIFRAGLQSVAAGQVDAARSIGLTYWGAMRTVILPQAVRIVVPPLTNEGISLLKASSLLFYIGVQELTYEGRILTFGGKLVETYLMVTAIYLAMTVPLSKVVAWLERRYRIPGLGLQQEVGGRPARGARSLAARVLGVDGGSLRTAARAVRPALKRAWIRGPHKSSLIRARPLYGRR
ncbi:MAG: hypothetical protein A3K65_02710 [Euryarchaeota archaeon RBG_16_68_12]|nr:MAG: hypothetical protein A3K65_02710 [Euryarchaeota archaeon RBG_16_68_12]